MRQPRLKDDNGNWVYAGDTITFSFGIPPLKVMAQVIDRHDSLWALPYNTEYSECRLRSLRRYVGAWWKAGGHE